MNEPVTQLGVNQKLCMKCQNVLPAQAGFCDRCGAQQLSFAGGAPYAAQPQGGRSKVVAALLAFFLGGFGAHKFYLGRWGWGIVYMLFFWTMIPGIVAFIEFILLLVMSEEEFQRKYPGAANTGMVVVLCIAPFFFVVILGILAAIAIPNFIRYQLRSKYSQVTTEAQGLYQAELARLEAGQGTVELAVPAEAEPGSERVALSEEDQAAAEQVDWRVFGPTYGVYTVATQTSEDGEHEAFSICAESDIDADGQVAAIAYFHPAVANGQVVVEPPDAPCRFDPSLDDEASLSWNGSDGDRVALSPPNTF
ncbi:MAG: NINE protein [Anaeromyxobacter sp.]